MKVTYESNDMVEIEDCFGAGDAAACIVILRKKAGTEWTAEVFEGFDETEAGDIVTVDEKWIKKPF